MPNWCSTDYIIESDNKELLQRICNAINECAAMKKPLVKNSATDWAGNTFKMLGITTHKADRCFWSAAEIKDGNLHFHEEGAWCRGASIVILEDHFENEEGESELGIYFISEELGSGIFETNDTEGEYFKEKYIITTDDDTIYCNSFCELREAVQELLDDDTEFGSVWEMEQAALKDIDEDDEDDEGINMHIYEINYVSLW